MNVFRRFYKSLMSARYTLGSSLRCRRFWKSAPANAFTLNGYELIANFMPLEECQRLVELARATIKDHSYRVKDLCYTTVRAEIGVGKDLRVKQVMNVHLIDSKVNDLAKEGAIQRLFAERLGEPISWVGFSIQFDGVDTKTKRGYHLDGAWPPLYKAFIYLTDVDADGDGPYTVIPGSNRHVLRKAMSQFINGISTGERSDMPLYSDKRCVRMYGKAGTLVLSTQDLVHKGWHDHYARDRYVLIGEFKLARFFDGKPITRGLNRIREDYLAAPAPVGAAEAGFTARIGWRHHQSGDWPQMGPRNIATGGAERETRV